MERAGHARLALDRAGQARRALRTSRISLYDRVGV
jgi:hypothetical protein